MLLKKRLECGNNVATNEGSAAMCYSPNDIKRMIVLKPHHAHVVLDGAPGIKLDLRPFFATDDHHRALSDSAIFVTGRERDGEVHWQHGPRLTRHVAAKMLNEIAVPAE